MRFQLGGVNDQGRSVLAANDANASMRAMGVRKLLQEVESTPETDPVHQLFYACCSATESSQEVTKSALLARVCDSDAGVLDALYASPDALVSQVGTDDLVQAISAAIRAPDAAVEKHIAFVCKVPVMLEAALKSVVLPSILFTKARAKVAREVWQILADVEPGRLGLLQGCPEIASNEEGKVGKSDKMATLNTAVVAAIAGMRARKICSQAF